MQEKRRLSFLTRIAILAGFYFVGGIIGEVTSFRSGSLVLPASGIGVAALLLFGQRFWPGVALGAVFIGLDRDAGLGILSLGPIV
ncbi:MAG: hypothetical protein AB1813_22290, partial [Verrucomicrobiota bacterium]